MNLNYLILAHKNTTQVERLIKKLYTEKTQFYVHIDKAANIGLFKKELSSFSNIKFVDDENRINIIWGNISIVKATLQLIKMVILDERQGHCILLSGQDYPLKSNEFINHFFEKHKDVNFISSERITSESFDNRGLSRINHYNFHPYKHSTNNIEIPPVYLRLFYRKRTFKQVFRLLFSNKWYKLYMIFLNRTFPDKITPYGGSQWWALPMKSIKLIHSFLINNPDYLKYHEYTQVPDEIFFHSILHTKISNDLIKPNITYVKWPKTETPSPITFTINDFEELHNSKAIFARKFDINLDKQIMDKLDSQE
ncbi:beta-1,6-N-acetylglucosaminyltransferase [Sabulilitoribacter multivorans]|uniref:Peptide O-xylosyltransferase n=1 Tax=Flaviramulus multivorans TaxID=1304750 RepID=A0ABS9IH08_9FLAO|nr:beta-1,6-N-acetylglucosaminyltransferase [Flaviramulus multivorans]MCF7560037.1 beta-1,6-N-acetylglucosaminyltransferase [Flaviramulus multivorans]